MKLAIRIRKIRESYKLSQADVAYKANISPSAYGQIERKASNSSVNTLQRIADSIGVSLPFLLDIDNLETIEKNKL